MKNTSFTTFTAAATQLLQTSLRLPRLSPQEVDKFRADARDHVFGWNPDQRVVDQVLPTLTSTTRSGRVYNRSVVFPDLPLPPTPRQDTEDLESILPCPKYVSLPENGPRPPERWSQRLLDRPRTYAVRFHESSLEVEMEARFCDPKPSVDTARSLNVRSHAIAVPQYIPLMYGGLH